MSTAAQVTALAQVIGVDVKALFALTGALADLDTTANNSLVDAINEIVTASNASSGIDDNVTASGSTWSSNKISQELSTALSNFATGAPDLLNTIDELAAALGDNPDAITALQTLVGNNSTALSTLAANVGDTNTDYVAIYNTAKA